MNDRKYDRKFDRRRALPIQSIVFGAILVLLFLLVCRLFAPFFTILLWSILFYIIFNPVHERCIASFDRSTHKGKIMRTLWAAVFSLGTVILILLPLLFMGFQLFRQATELIHQVRDYLTVRPSQNNPVLEEISRIIGDITFGQVTIDAADLQQRILAYISSGIQNLIQLSGQAAKNVGIFLLGLVFMVFSLYFFFMDGAYLSRLVLRVIPIRGDYLAALVGKFKDITRQLVLGYIIVALGEAVLAFILFSFFRVSGAMVLAVIIFFLTFFPMIGAGIVYVPLGLLRIVNGSVAEGVLLMAASAVFISSVELFVRPIFLRDRIQMHPLIIFFAILGGLLVFGLNGLILGPMVVILFLTVFDLFLTEHKLEQDSSAPKTGAVNERNHYRGGHRQSRYHRRRQRFSGGPEHQH